MKIALDTNPRINPTELRYLRQATVDVDTGCKRTAIQAIVAYAWLHHQMDLRDEATYLNAELDAAGIPRLNVVNA